MISSIRLTTRRETEASTGGNRRTARRHAVRTVVQYRPAGGGSPTGGWRCGQTLDMSVGGILIGMARPLPVGSRWELELEWPGLYHGKPMMRLALTGAVVRNDGGGTALRILSHQFREVGRAERKQAVA